MADERRVCTRCVMDTSAADIEFDDRGVCTYCTDFLQRSEILVPGGNEDAGRRLESLLDRVRRAGRSRRYDCVVGVSGGVDSSWVLVRVTELGLRPLAVHMDNGWNSELAQNNIAELVRGLGVDLHTHVIDWTEYRRLMQAFFDADVVDVELLYDNAMLAVNYHQAARFGIRYLLAGTNHATEGMRMPKEWNWLKFDRRNIVALARRFGNVPIKTFPSIGTVGFLWHEFVRRIRWVSFLDHMDYTKTEATRQLQSRFGFKPYPYKHYESVFTRFYQGYLLPAKFGIDKRRVHLSTLVMTGEMTRTEAEDLLRQSPYPSLEAFRSDRDYFLKKMRWTPAQLDAYVRRPPRPHEDYPNERALWEGLSKAYLRVRPHRRR